MRIYGKFASSPDFNNSKLDLLPGRDQPFGGFWEKICDSEFLLPVRKLNQPIICKCELGLASQSLSTIAGIGSSTS